jgi:hypothetical protein
MFFSGPPVKMFKTANNTAFDKNGFQENNSRNSTNTNFPGPIKTIYVVSII